MSGVERKNRMAMGNNALLDTNRVGENPCAQIIGLNQYGQKISGLPLTLAILSELNPKIRSLLMLATGDIANHKQQQNRQEDTWFHSVAV
jgi:hypothetical protein